MRRSREDKTARIIGSSCKRIYEAYYQYVGPTWSLFSRIFEQTHPPQIVFSYYKTKEDDTHVHLSLGRMQASRKNKNYCKNLLHENEKRINN